MQSQPYQNMLYTKENKKLNYMTANDEIIIAVNGPELREADALRAKALDKKFLGRVVGTFQQNKHYSELGESL